MITAKEAWERMRKAQWKLDDAERLAKAVELFDTAIRTEADKGSNKLFVGLHTDYAPLWILFFRKMSIDGQKEVVRRLNELGYEVCLDEARQLMDVFWHEPEESKERKR